jgi:hypothetical protein
MHLNDPRHELTWCPRSRHRKHLPRAQRLKARLRSRPSRSEDKARLQSRPSPRSKDVGSRPGRPPRPTFTQPSSSSTTTGAAQVFIALPSTSSLAATLQDIAATGSMCPSTVPPPAGGEPTMLETRTTPESGPGATTNGVCGASSSSSSSSEPKEPTHNGSASRSRREDGAQLTADGGQQPVGAMEDPAGISTDCSGRPATAPASAPGAPSIGPEAVAAAGMGPARGVTIAPAFSFRNLPAGGSLDDRGGAVGGRGAGGVPQVCGRTTSADGAWGRAEVPLLLGAHIEAVEGGDERASGLLHPAERVEVLRRQQPERGPARKVADETTQRSRGSAASLRQLRWTSGWRERGRREDSGSCRGGGGAGRRWEIKAAAAASYPPSRTWSRVCGRTW